MAKQKRKQQEATAAHEVQEAAGNMPIKENPGAADPTEQEAAIIAEAARITGKPAADLTEEQAEAAVFDEIGVTTPHTDPEKIVTERYTRSMERLADYASKATKTAEERIAPIYAAMQQAAAPMKKDAEQIASVLNVIKDGVTEIRESYKIAQSFFSSVVNSEELKLILQTATTISENYNAIREQLQEVQLYFSCLEEELKKPEYEGMTAEQLEEIAEQAEDGQPNRYADLWQQARNNARAAMERMAAAAKEEPQHTAIKRAELIEYPLDKPNSIIWSLLEKDTQGQISINMAKNGSRQKLPAYYAINFDELGGEITITKRLLPFDKRVYIAVSALFNAGNTVITLSQIYYAMGNLGNPGTRDLTKINDAITKMAGARIFFDNEQEAAKYKYSRFKYDGSLLPMERGTAIVNGQMADAAIHVFREPPLIAFAKQRKQITTVDVKLLQSPVSKTDANLQIDDYLIERLSKAKKGKAHGSSRILFKTLYENAGIPEKPKTNTERQQKKRAPAKIEKYLKHYQKETFITRFTMEKDGITVYW